MVREELVLIRAYVDVYEDKTQKSTKVDAFLERILENFNVQLGGLDRSQHQVNSKWKNFHRKCNEFKCIYNPRMNSLVNGRYEADVLKDT